MKCDHLDFCIQCQERQAQTIAATRAAVLEQAATIVRKWNFMACSDADGLISEICAIITQPDADALEEVKRAAKREGMLEEHGNSCECYYGPTGDFVPCEHRMNIERDVPIDTPPAAERAGDVVCPRCKQWRDASLLYLCPDCHGTRKQRPADSKKGEGTR